MKRPTVIAGIVISGLVGALLAWPWLDLGLSISQNQPSWAELPWPFAMDEWGKGKAFQCKASDCGTAVTLYVRSKLGSCNCTTGVASDDDLDRMSDFALIGGDVSPLADGRQIKIGWMNGRIRAYSLRTNNTDNAALSIVFNDRCDMMAATVVSAKLPDAIAIGVMEFLNSKSMLHWAELEFGI